MDTDRFVAAFRYAAELHRSQLRKGTDIPYISHLMAVAATVLDQSGDEDQAVAALLHDAIEDHLDGGRTRDTIRARREPVPPVLISEC
jgi:(p)ppGpp synthase/HD superfamily hydrolase